MANGKSGLIIRPLGEMVAALQQLYQKPPDSIRGIDPGQWGSPLQPIQPIAPEGTEPRGWEWWWGQNLNFVPRPDAEYTAADLKYLSTYPLARICIENTKDLVCRAPWEIRLKKKPGESKADLRRRSEKDGNLKKLNEFFSFPDTEHNWSEWLRILIEDLMVIDAPSILIRKTMKGEVAQLRVIRGESIVRLIDQNGWTPAPPNPAYQQNWWGLPLVNLTTDQLIYKPRNIVPRNSVSSQLYGFSPVESIAEEIKIGQKRLEFMLAYFESGNIPGVVQVVPKGISPEKISEAMVWMNSELAGNVAAKHQWRMIPGFTEDGSDQIIAMKEKLLADGVFDEMHIRKICFAFGTSPSRLMRMMGTRNAEQQQEAATEEGILPVLDWVKGTIDYIIQHKMNLMDYEIEFEPFKEVDPKKEMDIATGYVKGGIRTINEVREKLGDDKRPEPEADMLGMAGQQFTPISGPGMLSAMPEPVVPKEGEGNGNGVSGKEQYNGKESKEGKPGEGKPGEGKPEGKPNGTNGKPKEKAHCGEHSEYDIDCIHCANAEIYRLEKNAPAYKPQVVEHQEIKDPVGFAAANVGLSQIMPTAPVFYKDDEAGGHWVTIEGKHVYIDDIGKPNYGRDAHRAEEKDSFNYKIDKPTEEETSTDYSDKLEDEFKAAIRRANVSSNVRQRASDASYVMLSALSSEDDDQKIVLRDNEGKLLGALALQSPTKHETDISISYIAANPNVVLKTKGWPKGGIGTTLMAEAAKAAKGHGVILYSLGRQSDKFYDAIGMHREKEYRYNESIPLHNDEPHKYIWSAKEAAKFARGAKLLKVDNDEQGEDWIHAGLEIEEELGPPLAIKLTEKVEKGWVTLHDGRHVFIDDGHGIEDKEQSQQPHDSPEKRESHLSSKPVSESKLGGGRNQTFLIEFEDGEKAVFKPSAGESKPLAGEFEYAYGYQTQKEVGAWQVAKIVHMDDMVPPVIKSNINGAEGALMEFQRGEPAYNFTGFERYDGVKDFARAATFDYVIGNPDRHAGNWLVDKGKLHLIDHGSSFIEKPFDPQIFQTNIIERANSLDQFQEIRSIRDKNAKPWANIQEYAKPYTENKSKILDALSKTGLPKGSVDEVSKRIDRLGKAKNWSELYKQIP